MAFVCRTRSFWWNDSMRQTCARPGVNQGGQQLVDAPDYFHPSALLPLPLNPNLPAGGPYAALSFVYYEYTNPLKPQSIGFSGCIVTNPDVGSPVGTVIGSGIE